MAEIIRSIACLRTLSAVTRISMQNWTFLILKVEGDLDPIMLCCELVLVMTNLPNLKRVRELRIKIQNEMRNGNSDIGNSDFKNHEVPKCYASS